MSASDRLQVLLQRNAVGDWIVKVDGRTVVGILWDEHLDDRPIVVVWDELGEAGERMFMLHDLLPSLPRGDTP